MRLHHALPLIALAIASRLDAQSTMSGPASAAASSASSVDVKEMKAALRALVMKQEAFWSEHGSYTADMSALGLYPRPASANGTPAVQVIFAGSRGWTGMATQSTMKGTSCVVFVGNPDELPKLPATMRSKAIPSVQGAPLCDER
ncbi:MAG TPA: hypothetical protein VFI52_07950 [Gemmatimonadaceae bacterium]|nr:hypothetical protein [Gemmatimonadaceae bacterium]